MPADAPYPTIVPGSRVLTGPWEGGNAASSPRQAFQAALRAEMNVCVREGRVEIRQGTKGAAVSFCPQASIRMLPSLETRMNQNNQNQDQKQQQQGGQQGGQQQGGRQQGG